MDSLRTGSDELVYIQTEKLSVSIKGPAAHPNLQGVEYREGDSTLRITCDDEFQFLLREGEPAGIRADSGTVFSGIYTTRPLFFEQQRYELVIEPEDGQNITFWHDNLNIRSKVTETGRRHKILSGVINFGNEIGLSDLVIQINGEEYLRLVIEVFPSKISYREDYRAIVEDVTREVYNVVFDFLKKTYWSYRQSDKTASSPVEFFAVLQKIYDDFIRASDRILLQPHHVLETTHETMPSYKIKRTDRQSIRWIEKHPEQVQRNGNRFAVQRALAVKKQVSYDTRENRLTKYILQTTAKKLQDFKRSYLRLQRAEDSEVIRRIDAMVAGLNRRSSASFLAEVPARQENSGMSLVFSMAPGYRELYTCYLMLLHGLSITGDMFHVSVKDLAVLYEYWCFIKLNSLLKDRYELVSQDIIKVQGNGLSVSLVKGRSSRVKYRTPSGEKITLSYNPKETGVPTVTQRPDNVLTLEKTGAAAKYEYVFDAKYRINPALEGTDYYNSISHTPGPEVDDINTMHRYRDAIVYSNGASPYERTMFGAYVLFPYSNEREYRQHRFCQSIGKVNIGGLPFLPSATKLVTDILDELISDSPDSAFERATLPVGIEEKLKKIDWSVRDVLIGTLRNKDQLDQCIRHRFYHTPIKNFDDSDFPIRYVAVYQSKKLFGSEAGIHLYGEVTRCSVVKRREITEIPKSSDELYYRFEIKEWKELPQPIAKKEIGFKFAFTNLFLLEHSTEIPELWIRSEEEYRLYMELKRSLDSAEISSDDPGFQFGGARILFEDGEILIMKDRKIIAKHSAVDFSRSPNAVFRRIQKEITMTEN